VIRESRLKKLDTSFPIVVTSYEIIMRDRKFLQASLTIIARIPRPNEWSSSIRSITNGNT
jgi:hypothetical protein